MRTSCTCARMQRPHGDQAGFGWLGSVEGCAAEGKVKQLQGTLGCIGYAQACNSHAAFTPTFPHLPPPSPDAHMLQKNKC
eukprot:365608-Chlamydomonas_euryale.AAC.26